MNDFHPVSIRDSAIFWLKSSVLPVNLALIKYRESHVIQAGLVRTGRQVTHGPRGTLIARESAS